MGNRIFSTYAAEVFDVRIDSAAPAYLVYCRAEIITPRGYSGTTPHVDGTFRTRRAAIAAALRATAVDSRDPSID